MTTAIRCNATIKNQKLPKFSIMSYETYKTMTRKPPKGTEMSSETAKTS